MNYFQELLESYEKIKQRKFALRIDERGEFQQLEKTDPDKAEAIEQKLSQEFEGYSPGKPSENVNISIGNLPTVDVPEGESAGTMNLPATNQAYSVTLRPTNPEEEGGTAVYYRREGSSTNAMIISGGGKVNTRELSGYKNALANSHGDIAMLGGDIDTAKINAGSLLGTGATPQVKTALQGLVDSIRAAASNPAAEGMSWVDEPASYVVGNRGQSLEKKLRDLRLVRLSSATGRLEEVDMDPAVKSNMIQNALQSMENLYRMGLPNDSEAAKLRACTNLSNSIRKDKKGKIVALTAEDATEGIRFTPSPADKWFMDQAEKVCGQQIERTPVGDTGYDQHSINDFVGKTNEMASVVLAGVEMIPKLISNPTKQKKLFGMLGELTRKEIVADVNKFLQAWGPWLKKVDTGSLDARGAAIQEVAQEVEALVGGTEEEVMSFFMKLSALSAPLFNYMKPDIVLQVGKVKGQGHKADNSFVFIGDEIDDDGNVVTAKERAERAAAGFGIRLKEEHKKRLGDILDPAASKDFWVELHGLTEEDMDREAWHLGDGLKTKAKRFTEMTMGETDSVLNMIDGNAPEIAPGYYNVVKKRLGFTEQNVTEVREYNQQLRAQSVGIPQLDAQGNPVLDSDGNVVKATMGIDDVFPQGGLQVFDRETGNTTLSNGKTQLETVRGILADNSTFDELEHSELLRMFSDMKGNELDLSDPVNMAKVNEGLKRYFLAMKVSTDANDRDKKGKLTPEAMKARRWLVYNATLVGGVDAGLPSTVQDISSMETFSFSHNDAINDASRGVLNDTWSVEMPKARGEHAHAGATINMINREKTETHPEGDDQDKLSWRQSRTWNGAKAVTRGSLVIGRHAALKRAKVHEKIEVPQPENAETLLFGYLDNQQKILEDLVSLIKTS